MTLPHNFIAELILFIVGLPLLAFQSIEMLTAFIDFIAEFTGYYNHFK